MQDKREQLSVVHLNERPELVDLFWPQKLRIWPEFMRHDLYADKLWHHVDSTFADHQIYLVNEAEMPVAVVQTVPFAWDATLGDIPIGWQDLFLRAVLDHEADRAPNTLSALEAAIQPEYRGRGISHRLVNEVKRFAGQRGYQALLIAVRPSRKAEYPLTPMERYVRWTRDDGAPFDPWLRVHWRAGGEILHIAHPSMVCHGTVDEWEEWTGMAFPESGDYVVSDALAPIQIDRRMNIGRYVEPNVWVHHPITTNRLTVREPRETELS